ncbi:MAG: C39 family peptidase, partial [Candidatus Dormiibacterota bacterium]
MSATATNLSSPMRHRFGTAAVVAAAALAFAGHLATVADAASDTSVSGVLDGDPSWAVQYWFAQTQNDCTLASSADVVGQVTGDEPSESSVISRAVSMKLYNTSQYDSSDGAYGGGPITEDPSLIVKLLQSYGVQSSFQTGQTMAELEQDLAGGRAVIAGVDAEFIWNVTDPGANPSNDPDGYSADHALVVTGVDTATGIVSLNDSGNPNVGREERVPISVFEKAWAAPFETSQGRTIDNVLVVTSEKTEAPAPAPASTSPPASTSSHGGAAPAGHGTGTEPTATTADGAVNMPLLAATVAVVLAALSVLVVIIRRSRRWKAPAAQW